VSRTRRGWHIGRQGKTREDFRGLCGIRYRVLQTREEFPSGTFTSGDPAFTGGGGVRVLIGDTVFVGAEARLGWELHLRLNGIVGIRLP
jgi:hypothetical protein